MDQGLTSSLSVTGKHWHLANGNDRLIEALSQKYNLPEILCRLLVNRGVTLETAATYLKPNLRDLLPNPSILLDMDKAIERMVKALENNEKIAVYGDYDVDGACASALLRKYFSLINYPIALYIPDRIEEGYGANSQALEALYKQGITVVLMVDCGTNAFDPLKHAKNLGLDVIVLDHHTAESKLPLCTALVNPNRLDQDLGSFPSLKNLCAAGVSYLFLIALQRALRFNQWFKTFNLEEPNLLLFLDLVALATVCDVMPLTNLNRSFVSQGLKILRQRQNLGLKTLADVAGLSEAPTAYHLGFILGPRINAGGRVGKAHMGSRLLTSIHPTEALELANDLHTLNQQRQDIEKQVFEQALEEIEIQKLYKNPVLLIGNETWHPGIIGIVASRLKDQFNRPVCVVSFENNIGKGSGRSVKGACLGTAMHVAVQKGLLEKGGGHTMAAGFTVHKDKYMEFHNFLNDYLGNQLLDYIPALELDGYVSLRSLTPQFLTSIQQFEPYGLGNPTPRFAIRNLQIDHLDTLNNLHLKCIVKDQEKYRLKAMAFRAKNKSLGNFLEENYHSKKLIEIAGTLHLSFWNGCQQISIFIEDAKYCF